MRRALLVSGGNARGAVQVAPLASLSPLMYEVVLCCSVGSINGPEWVALNLDEVDAMYREVDGLQWYLRPLWLQPWRVLRGGLTSILDRLGPKIRTRGTMRRDLPGPRMGVGVYSFARDHYRTIWADECADDEEWLRARLASCAIPGVMEGIEVDGEIYHDGGMRHVIPYLPDWRSYDEVDVVLASSVRRSDAKSGSGWGWLLGRIVDAWIDTTVIGDLWRLQRMADAGVRVRLFAPRYGREGASFDASHATMLARLDEGEWMADHPFTLRPGGHVIRDYMEWIDERD